MGYDKALKERGESREGRKYGGGGVGVGGGWRERERGERKTRKRT